MIDHDASTLDGAEVVAVCVPDSIGRLIGKRVSAERWPRVRERGLPMPDFHLVTGIENLPFEGFEVTGMHSGYPNGLLRPLDHTMCRPGWEPSTAFVLADCMTLQGTLVDEAPRAILRRQTDRLTEHGKEAKVASELEFYLFASGYRKMAAGKYRRRLAGWHRQADNDVLVAGFDEGFVALVRRTMSAIGIAIEVTQGEGGPGQHELNLSPHAPLQAADQHVLYKHGVKALAHQVGRSVTFMAKPQSRWLGSSSHVHFFLTEADGTPAFGVDDLSEFGRQFLAGLLAFTPELTLLHAPYANSYKRLHPDSFAPFNATWGWDNRTCMVRVVGRGIGCRFELRLPGADANPYYSYAALVAAGLEGVDACLDAPPPTAGNAYADTTAPPLPRDLTESVRLFATSRVAARAFGAKVHRHLTLLAERELDSTRRAVTDWERCRAFEAA